ncbi:MAG: histidine phosphatase family protein, partial [Sphingomonadaceae bacterium]|nr:histidine phosphatase family protein [Sphingomonadaceae bacterium]
AHRMGRYLRDEALGYDHVVASPAMRVQQTIAGVEDGYGQPLAPAFDRRIYMASASTLLDVVHALDDTHANVLLVGHNPGLEDLVLMLVPQTETGLRDEVEIKYPTATLAEMRFDVDRWADIDENGGTLVRLMRPRELDPALGPDES